MRISIAIAARAAAFGIAFAACAAFATAQDAKPSAKDDKPSATDPKATAKPAENPAGDMVAIPLKLPKPAFKGTPKDVPPGTNLEPPRKGARPDFLAPKGATNLALNKPVKASDNDPIIGSHKLITDGDKEATEGSYVEYGPGLQWVQIDLGKPGTIYAILVWHKHMNAVVYHDVVVQAADDADFTKNVKTIFSNDHDNSSGLGVGDAKEYWETFEGKLIDAKGIKAQYLRFYTKGSTADDQNHYTEIEVYGS